MKSAVAASVSATPTPDFHSLLKSSLIYTFLFSLIYFLIYLVGLLSISGPLLVFLCYISTIKAVMLHCAV